MNVRVFIHGDFAIISNGHVEVVINSKCLVETGRELELFTNIFEAISMVNMLSAQIRDILGTPYGKSILDVIREIKNFLDILCRMLVKSIDGSVRRCREEFMKCLKVRLAKT